MHSSPRVFEKLKNMATTKKPTLEILEEDDEFEEFEDGGIFCQFYPIFLFNLTTKLAN